MSSHDSLPHTSAKGGPLLSPLRHRMHQLLQFMRHHFRLRYFIFLLVMEALSEVLAHKSDLSPLHAHLRIEIPLMLALYWAFNFMLRPTRPAPWVAAAPFVLAYVACDVFFVAYGDVLRIVDLQNLPELVKVLPLAKLSILLLAVGLPPVLLLAYIDYKHLRRPIAVFTGLGLILLALEFRPGMVLSTLDLGHLNIATYSDAQSINDNGRLTMLAFFEASRKVAIAQTRAYGERTDWDQHVQETAELLRQDGNHRNVYVVVMESFLDPTLFENVNFSQSPRHPDYQQLVGNKLSFSISPVFGGGTAQAEFEVLCGVPALAEFSEIDFDNFTGHRTGCMPDILSKAGYSTYVTNVYQPDYFNSTKAYTGIGFQKLYFPLEYSPDRDSYLSIRNASDEETYLFDGDLFTQQLSFIARKLKENPHQPMLNYMLTMYGHEPHDIDVHRRPLVLSMTGSQDDQQLLRAANQHWYRSQAVAAYVRELVKLDPHSLILIVSDHVPPLNLGTNSYKNFDYLGNREDSVHMNRLLVIENGQLIQHKTIHHYDVPALVFSYLSKNHYCEQNRCNLTAEQRQQNYRSLMARAVAPN